MHIGIVGPCSSGPLAEFLPEFGGKDIGWGGYLVVNVVRALIARGHRVSVVTLSPEITHRQILRGPRLTYYAYPTRTKKRMRDLFELERAGLREGILLAKPDVLHAHWTYEFAMACLETGLPTVITSHDNAFQQVRFSKDLYRLGRLLMQIMVIRKSQVLTAESPYLAHSLQWLAKTEITVIPNAVEVPIKNPCNKGAGGIKIATILNGWGDRKNPKAAIKAFNLLQQALPEAEMFMFGHDFEERGIAAQWTESKASIRNIHFCGPFPFRDLQRRLQEMSILLHPAREESFGMAVAEAMALGLPVVAGNDSGAVPWLLDEGRAGFITDVRKPEKIAEALLRCVRETQDRKRKQENAYQRVMTLFSPNFVAGQYERTYEKALSLQA
jgi:glycosyltransferase involved in cell wall biosynthesis